jgi:hypothetical protein
MVEIVLLSRGLLPKHTDLLGFQSAVGGKGGQPEAQSMVDPALFALHFKAFCLPVTLTLPLGETATSQRVSLSVAPILSFTSAFPMAQASSLGEQQAFLLFASSMAKLAVPSTASTVIGAPVSFRTQNP